METLFIYGIKSSALIAMFYLSYFALLRKETFFNSNRWFLLAGLITAVVLPMVVFTKIVWVDPTPNNFDWSKIPITTNTTEKEAFEINWYIVLAIIYSIGILVFLMKFGFDFFSLYKVLKGKTIQKQADFKFIDVTENISPFSYFNSIVYNSSLYNETELKNILEHEKIHSTQYHTIDVLIARLFCAVFWFNPIVWLYKNAIAQNLEFIADSEASKIISDKKAYQLTLLKITTQENCVAITNHFYQSLIKKRIVMLNKNQSNKRNSWKYLLVLPLLCAYVFFFQVKVIAQEKESEKTAVQNLKKVENKVDVYKINSTTTDTELKEKVKALKEKYDITLALHITSKSTSKELNAKKDFFKEEFDVAINFSEIKTNNDNEIIAIKVELKNKEGITKINQITGEKPIQPFNVFVEKLENKKIKFGFSTTRNQNSENHFKLVNALKSAKNGNLNIDEDLKYWTIDNYTNGETEYLIVINGQKQSKNNKIKIPLDEEILSQNDLTPEVAVKKYGKDGENGAVEISTKENVNGLNYNAPTDKKEAELDKSEIENTGNETVSSKGQWLKMYKTLYEARFSLERMKVKNEQAKLQLEKARIALKAKLFS